MKRKRIDWKGDPPIRAVVTSINPRAAKAIRQLRDVWPNRRGDGAITDKGVVIEAISAGLHALARKHLGDPTAWPADKRGMGVSDWNETDDGLYMAVFVDWGNEEIFTRERDEEARAVKRLDERKRKRQARRGVEATAPLPAGKPVVYLS